MAIDFLTGFGPRVLTGAIFEGLLGGSGLSIDTTTHLYDGQSLLSGANGHYGYRQLTSVSGQIAVQLVIRPDMTRTTTATSIISMFRDAGTTNGLELVFDGIATANGNNAIGLRPLVAGTPGTRDDMSFVPANGTWYVIEIKADTTANPWTVTWRMKPVGGSFTERTFNPAVAAMTFSYMYLGSVSTASGWAINFDQFITARAQTDYIGEGAVLSYSPDSVGTHNLDAATSVHFFKDIGGTETALTTSETTSYQQIDDLPMDADTDHILLKKVVVAGSTTYADPNGAGTAVAWTGTVTNIDDAVRQPTAPSDGLTISSSTDEGSETVLMSNPTYVAGATYTLWVYGTGGAKRAVDVAYNYTGADPGTAHATRAELIGAGAAAGWYSRVLTAPANQTELDAMRVQFICNSTAGGGGATACSVNACYLEITTPDIVTQPTNTWYTEHGFEASGESTDPLAVRAVIAQRNDSGTDTNSITSKVWANANETNIFSGSLGSATTIYKQVVLATAPGGAAWTDAIFDAATLRWGYSDDADSTPRVESAMFEALFAVAAGPTEYLFDADPGVFVITGVASNLLSDRVVVASPGTYAVTGIAAGTFIGRFLNSDPGAFVISGVAAGLLSDRMIAALPGSYVVSGASAITSLGRFLNADPGTYAITGVAAGLLAERLINALPGSYSVTGVAALTEAARAITADPGSFIVSGASADLVYAGLAASYSLDLEPGVYTISGFAAAVVADKIMIADPGAYAITGVSTDLIAARELAAEPGSLVITGVDAQLPAGRMIAAIPGGFVISGEVADLVLGGLSDYVMNADPGTYLITGRDAIRLINDPGGSAGTRAGQGVIVIGRF